MFACEEFEGDKLPHGKAIISDNITRIHTKPVEWKKEFHLKGNKPGAFFTSGKAAFFMEHETEVKELSTILSEGKDKLKQVRK